MAEWIYSVKSKGNCSYDVTAKCSECGWDWFSEDGVGNYHAVFGAFITNYTTNPSAADAFLLDTARKNNKLKFCPMCGAKLTDEPNSIIAGVDFSDSLNALDKLCDMSEGEKNG